MAGRLQNKVAVITGAGSGHGMAVALAFALEGSKGVVVDMDGEKACETVHLVRGKGGETFGLCLDIRRFELVRRMSGGR